MIISYAWTTDALMAGRKKVTRRDWSKEYAARFREGTVQKAYSRQARFGGKHIGDVKITRPPYPERCRDIPDDDYEGEGFAYMEERGLLIRGRTPREFFDDLRRSRQVLFVVRFELVAPCDRCGGWTTLPKFGPNETDMRLCAPCWSDWEFYAEDRSRQCNESLAGFKAVYSVFCETKGGRNDE